MWARSEAGTASVRGAAVAVARGEEWCGWLVVVTLRREVVWEGLGGRYRVVGGDGGNRGKTRSVRVRFAGAILKANQRRAATAFAASASARRRSDLDPNQEQRAMGGEHRAGVT